MAQTHIGLENISQEVTPAISRILNEGLSLAKISEEITHTDNHLSRYFLIKLSFFAIRPWSFALYELDADDFEEVKIGGKNPYRKFNKSFKLIDPQDAIINQIWAVNQSSNKSLIFYSSRQALNRGFLYDPSIDPPQTGGNEHGEPFFWYYPNLHTNNDIERAVATYDVKEEDLPASAILWLEQKMGIYFAYDKEKFKTAADLERELPDLKYNCIRQEEQRIRATDTDIQNFSLYKKNRDRYAR